MNNALTLALSAGIIAAIVGLFAIFTQYVRPVAAEDDCAFNTYAVERVPGIGLVCIGEPS